MPDGAGNPQEAGHSAVVERIHSLLYRKVEEAVEPVADLERGWTPNEMTKRIVRYIYKAASNEDLQRMPWRECVKSLVERAMSGYSAACQEKDWFFEIQLIPVFQSVAWELLKANRSQGVSHQKLQDLVTVEYEDKLDRILLTKAMWDASRNSFQEDNVVSKIYAALSKTYDTALDEAVGEERHVTDEKRMQNFTKRWINESMQRCWNSVENSERIVTERSVTKLFGNLVAPFGDDHPFSCIPNIFFPEGERPHRTWPYIRSAVRQMFESWAREQSAPSKKRRKTKRSVGSDEEAQEEALPEREEPPRRMEEEDKLGSEEEAAFEEDVEEDAMSPHEDEEPPLQGEGSEGHTECTSQEDCVGSMEDRLVQHILNGNPGDIYCKSCWTSFLEQNDGLEGIFEDNGEAFQL